MIVKYKAIASALEQEINSGQYSKTNKIPSESELVTRFKVSRNTIRKALETLVQRGIVYQVQGSGVFVRKFEEENLINLQNMNGLTNDFPHCEIETKLLDFKLIKADETIANKMRCKVGADVYFVNRLRIIDGCPYTIEYSYFNKNLVLYLSKDIVMGSIYNYIREDLKLTIGLIQRIIYAEPISEENRKLLNLKDGSPALLSENIAELNTGEVFDYSKSIINSEKYKFTILSNLK